MELLAVVGDCLPALLLSNMLVVTDNVLAPEKQRGVLLWISGLQPGYFQQAVPGGLFS